MDTVTINSEGNFNLKNLDSTIHYEEIIDCSDGQFLMLQMDNSNEAYAVSCTKDISKEDIYQKLTKDGFLVEECQVENRFVGVSLFFFVFFY